MSGTLNIALNNTFIVNTSNPSTGLNYPGIYLSNFTYYGYGSNNSVVKSSQYNFVNSLYSNTLTTNSGSSVGGVQLVLSNMGDIYYGSNYFSGYFYKTALTVQADYLYFIASNKPYTFGVSNNYGSNLTSGQLWVDNFRSNLQPSVVNMFVDTGSLSAPEYYTFVSGVLTFNSVGPTYNFWLQGQNIGSNFFINPPVSFGISQLLYSPMYSTNLAFDPLTTPFYSAAATGSVLTTAAQNSRSNTFFYLENVTFEGMGGFVNTAIFTPISNTAAYLSGQTFNQNGSSATVSNVVQTSNGVVLYFDTRSAAIVNDPNAGTLNNSGIRVKSGSNNYPVYNPFTSNTSIEQFGGLYDNRCNITNLAGVYYNELQLANGVYGAPIGGQSYLNYSPYYNPIPSSYTYPDYTNWSAPSGVMRYATFMWTITDPRQAYYGYFKILNTNFTAPVGPSFNPTSNISLTYKLFCPSVTSSWIDGNQLYDYDNIGTLPYNFTSGDGQPGAIFSDSGGVQPYPVQTTITDRYIFLTDGNTPGMGNGPFNIYMRIGIPKDSGLYFGGIQLVDIIYS